MATVIYAPIAVMKVNGVPIGKMKSVRLTENIRRGKVTGLGRLTPTELPALEWEGTMSCGFYLVDFSKTVFNDGDRGKALFRKVQTVQEFVDTVLLQEQGIQVELYKKVVGSTSNTGVIQGTLELYARVEGIFMTRDGMDISESQISGRDAEFQYINPVIYPA